MARIIVFATENLLGDTLEVTPTIQLWKRKYPGDYVVVLTPNNWISEVFENNPYIDEIVDFTTGFLKDNCQKFVYQGIATDGKPKRPNLIHYFNVGDAFSLGTKSNISMAESYAKLAGFNFLAGNVPEIYLTTEELKTAHNFAKDFGSYIVLSPYSRSNEPFEDRDNKDPDYRSIAIGNKAWGISNWQDLITRLTKGFPQYRRIVVGAENDKQHWAGVEYWLGKPIREVAGLLSNAYRLITVDNGVAHLGMATKTPIIELYPKCLPNHWVSPFYNSGIYHGEPKDVSVDDFWQFVNKWMSGN